MKRRTSLEMFRSAVKHFSHGGSHHLTATRSVTLPPPPMPPISASTQQELYKKSSDTTISSESADKVNNLTDSPNRYTQLANTCDTLYDSYKTMMGMPMLPSGTQANGVHRVDSATPIALPPASDLLDSNDESQGVRSQKAQKPERLTLTSRSCGTLLSPSLSGSLNTPGFPRVGSDHHVMEKRWKEQGR